MPKMRSHRMLLTAAALLTALALLVPASAQEPPEVPACDQRAPTFREPIRLGTGQGYEPGIEIDSQGTIFVTAHKLSLVAEGGTSDPRTASWLWRSTDLGQTFQDMTGLLESTKLLYAFEGDLAVDAEDRLYFVDTWAGDNHFYRWSDRGATLDLARPAVPTYEVDDRPWLAAHHDGYVYYLSNTGYKHDGRLTIHRSTDAGLTFDPVGFTFLESGWGFIDADPNSGYVYGFMDDLFYGTGVLGNATGLFAWVSPDRGESWTQHSVAPYEFGADGNGFPNVAVSPTDGSVYGIWSDDGRKVKLARSTDHGQTWATYDISPFPGSYAFPWVTVGPTGDVGVFFAADPNDPAAGSGTFVYGMIWRPTSDCLLDPEDPESLCTGPAEAYARLQQASTGNLSSQADFIQLEMSPEDNAINVPFERAGNQIMFTRQTSGPNMDGTPFCGVIGTP